MPQKRDLLVPEKKKSPRRRRNWKLRNQASEMVKPGLNMRTRNLIKPKIVIASTKNNNK